MKFDVFNSNNEKPLFSIILNDKIDIKRKVIVFAPNGVGKTSIAKSFIKKPKKLINGFFVNYESIDNNRLNIKLFNEEYIKGFKQEWVWKINNSLLTQKLIEQTKLERRWQGFLKILGIYTLPSTFVFPTDLDHWNNIFPNQKLRLTPSTEIPTRNKRENPFIQLYSSINNQYKLVKKIINWHLDFIIKFKKTFTKQEYSKDFLKKNKNLYLKQIKNLVHKKNLFMDVLNNTSPFHESYDYKSMGFTHNDFILINSWNFIHQIYNYYIYYNNYTNLPFEFTCENIDVFKTSLIEYNKLLELIKNNLDFYKKIFGYSNWILVKDYLKYLKKTWMKIEKSFKDQNLTNFEWSIVHNKSSYDYYVKVDFNKTVSEVEKKINLLMISFILNFNKEKINLLILDDLITSLDSIHTSLFVTKLKTFKSSKMLILTHNFYFYSKFIYEEQGELSNQYFIMDKFNNEEVFSIKIGKNDLSFVLGDYSSFYKDVKLELDGFLCLFILVYELIKSFSIWDKEHCKKFLRNIDWYIRHSVETKKGKNKTIRNFVNESYNQLKYYEEISLIKKFLKNYQAYLDLKKPKNFNSIIDKNLEEYLTNWDNKHLKEYKTKINNRKLSLIHYLRMKHLLILCCNAKHKKLENLKKLKKLKIKDKLKILKQEKQSKQMQIEKLKEKLNELEKKDINLEAIYDQIKSLKHFESLRFIPLFEISCEIIVNYIDYFNKQIKHTNKI